ncbi:MAG TPA: SMP-30/gluconolactonase/LRE family protein [Bacteroidales bacterium]|nr:SMP-30/gluconolactonase/LRE family protein [Bacteroidales bacterium]
MKFKMVLLAMPAIFAGLSFIQQPEQVQLVAEGAKLEKIVEGLKFGEGPAVDKKGNIYFTDQPNDRIMMWDSEESKVSTFMQPSGRANGLTFDKKGNLWAACDDKGEIWKIGPDKKVEKVVTEYEGKRLNGPNDVFVDKKGGVYFTDPFWVRDYWTDKTQPHKIMGVYYLKPDHKTVNRVIDDFQSPNGLHITPDGKRIIVADYRGRKTWSYAINKDGSLSDKKLFCEQGSDGLTIDANGNVYLCSRGVTIYNSNGEKIGNIEVPEQITNCCFGDKDMKTLYITGQTNLYRIRMNVKGIRG